MKKQLKRTLPDDIKTTNFPTKFTIKDKTDFQHKHNFIYHCKCPNEGCKDGYV